MFRVQLFSKPQQTVASSTNSEPKENLKLSVPSKDSNRLDSVTSAYYYNAGASAATMSKDGSSVNFYGDRKIRLFLDEIYQQQVHTQLGDLRLQLATAPVVLENHFALDSKPVMTRAKAMILFFLLSWIVGCLIAEVIDRRKELMAWLKA